MSPSDSDHVRPPSLGKFPLPFYYGAFVNLGIDYLVDPGTARELLVNCTAGSQLSVAEFGKQACLSVNYQVYFAQFARGAGVTQEIELNIVAHPKAAKVPNLTYGEYATGEDQTGNLGFCRYGVACDSQPAIDAGRGLFGEPKFRAEFDVTLPVPNGDPVRKGADWEATWYDTWSVACGKSGARPEKNGFRAEELLFSFTADLRNVTAEPVSVAPFTEFGTRKTGSEDKALAAPLNVFQPYPWYDLRGRTDGKVKLVPGSSPQVPPKDSDDNNPPKIDKFLGALQEKSLVGAWLYQSAPVAVQNRPYFLP